MTIWKSEVDLSDLHDSLLVGEIDVATLALCTANRFKYLSEYYKDDKLKSIIDSLLSKAFYENISLYDYDNYLEALTDWSNYAFNCKLII